jgi:hypothetical protein
MKVNIHIVRKSDGKEVIYQYEYAVTDESDKRTLKFSWQENNMSCDCNRHLCFSNWEGRDDDIKCGNDLYRVPYMIWEDGTKTLIDDEFKEIDISGVIAGTHVIVPVEPTEGMILDGIGQWDTKAEWRDLVRQIFKAMISARPKDTQDE